MDTVTQAVLGGAIGEAFFRRRLGGKAVLFGAVCGLLPDLDIISSFNGEWSMLLNHRGLSHSVFILTPLSFLFGWLAFKRWGRSEHLRSWIWLAFLALVTHPLLDICTSYGTQFYAPVSRQRLAIDAIGIIDPFYSVPLLIAVLLSWWRARRDSVPHWREFRDKLSLSFARGALAFTTLYLVCGFFISSSVRASAGEHLAASGFEVQRIRAVPSPLSLFLWHVVAADSGGQIRTMRYSVMRGGFYAEKSYAFSDDELAQKALLTEQGKIFAWFADGFLSAEVIRQDGKNIVVLSDRRYSLESRPESALFKVEFVFDVNGKLLSAHRLRGMRGNVGVELSAMCAAIFR